MGAEAGEGRKAKPTSAVDSVGQAIGSVGRALHELSETMEKIVEKLDGISASISELSHGPNIGQRGEADSPKPSPRRTPLSRSTCGEHGGPRKASISKGVDDLVRSGWLVKRSQGELIEKLQERYPGANSDNVLHVLKRRLNRSLVRIRAGKQWAWSTIET